jgi:predicted chitinase
MPILLSKEGLRRCFPKAPQAIIDAFVAKQEVLRAAGILDNPRRLAMCLANLAHESGGFAIRNLTESTAYTHARVAQVWPNRYRSANEVAIRFGSEPGWQLKMFDEIYGSRMGNRPGTNDGSRYIGRGGPQITGRDGYKEISRRTGLDLERNPVLATKAEHQPAIAAAFWSWKSLNLLADEGKFESIVRRWNGGLNGLADRRQWLARIEPICVQMQQGAFPPEEKPADRPAIPAEVSTGTGAGGTTVSVGVQQGWDVETIAFYAIIAVVVSVGITIFLKATVWKKEKVDASNTGPRPSGADGILPSGRDYPLWAERSGDSWEEAARGSVRLGDDALGEDSPRPSGPDRQH